MTPIRKHQTDYFTMKKRNPRLKGNTLKLQIPGLNKPIDIPFPAGKLAVCEQCKKNYKTRMVCRVRDRHTDLPWSTTYLCVSLDESCLTRNSKGEVTIVDEGPGRYRFIAEPIDSRFVSSMYITKKNHLEGAKAPICSCCKEKNYTKHHCREKQRHLHLPWDTVYVRLHAVPHPTTPTSPYFQENIPTGSKRNSSSSTSSSNESGGTPPTNKKRKVDDKENEDVSINDDIHKVEASRAFYLTINKDNCILRVSLLWYP